MTLNEPEFDFRKSLDTLAIEKKPLAELHKKRVDFILFRTNMSKCLEIENN